MDTIFFPARKFFRPEFPFNIFRIRHTPLDYNEDVRCRREFWKIVYVRAGHGNKVINGRKYPFQAGSLFVIHPDDETTYDIKSGAIEIVNLVFMPAMVASGLRELEDDFDFFAIFGPHADASPPEGRQQLYILAATRPIERLIAMMEEEFAKEPPNFRGMLKACLQSLLILACRQSGRKLASRRQEHIVHYVERLAAEHYAEDFDLGVVAKRIGVSKSHLCRLFKAATGVTVMARLLERRLEAARGLLEGGRRSVSEICFACGFNNLSYFYRAFEARHGSNPGAYRKKFAPH